MSVVIVCYLINVCVLGGVYMFNWEDDFDEIILERGRGYFITNYVKDCVFDELNHTISAVSKGSELYQVQITLDAQNSSPVNYSCTCPYATKNCNCKHMAAVMYQFEAQYHQEQVKESIGNNFLEPYELRAQHQADVIENTDEIDEKEKRRIARIERKIKILEMLRHTPSRELKMYHETKFGLEIVTTYRVQDWRFESVLLELLKLYKRTKQREPYMDVLHDIITTPELVIEEYENMYILFLHVGYNEQYDELRAR